MSSSHDWPLDQIPLLRTLQKIWKSLGWGKIFLALLLFIGLTSSWYTVQPDSQGLVRRFGKYVRTTDPGLHFKIPLVESVLQVPVLRQLKMEFGFSTPGASDEYQGSIEQNLDSNMLTGDLNSVVVDWVVQYKIKDPYQANFANEDALATLRDLAESTMRIVVGDRALDEVLTVGRDEVESDALTMLRSRVSELALGLGIDSVQMKGINPPNEVRNAFNQVNSAQQQKERIINEAQRKENEILPRVEGEAQRLLAEARGNAAEILNRSQGDVAQFNALYTEYQRTPKITAERLYLDMLSLSGQKLGEFIVLPPGSSDGQTAMSPALMPLMLDASQGRPRPAAPAAAERAN